MHSTHRTTTRRHDGREWLGLLLLATPFASALAWLTGWTDYVVFGVTPGWRTVAAALGVVAWTATWVRRPSPALRDEQLSRAARLLALAMLQGWVIERYSTGFYTSGALVEGITILLVVHVAAELMRRAGGSRRMAAIGDELSLGAAVCLAAFWLAAAGGWHSVAAFALLLSVPLLALVTILRGLVALRSSRRTASIAPLVVLAAGLSLSLAPTRAYADADPRVRWQHPAIRLVLNVPATRLDVFRAGSLERSYRVAVGAPSHASPLGDHAIVRIVWNPWWNPPDSPWARHERVTRPEPFAEAGIDTVRLDSRVLDPLARQARSGRVIVPLATLSTAAPQDASSRRMAQ